MVSRVGRMFRVTPAKHTSWSSQLMSIATSCCNLAFLLIPKPVLLMNDGLHYLQVSIIRPSTLEISRRGSDRLPRFPNSSWKRNMTRWTHYKLIGQFILREFWKGGWFNRGWVYAKYQLYRKKKKKNIIAASDDKRDRGEIFWKTATTPTKSLSLDSMWLRPNEEDHEGPKYNLRI